MQATNETTCNVEMNIAAVLAVLVLSYRIPRTLETSRHPCLCPMSTMTCFTADAMCSNQVSEHRNRQYILCKFTGMIRFGLDKTGSEVADKGIVPNTRPRFSDIGRHSSTGSHNRSPCANSRSFLSLASCGPRAPPATHTPPLLINSRPHLPHDTLSGSGHPDICPWPGAVGSATRCDPPGRTRGDELSC